MPGKKNQPDSSDRTKKNRIFHNSSCKRSNMNNHLKPICFENSIASKARDEDIIRACSLYNKTQEKIIKLKIAQIYFN
ncbi:MAG: hypothetical protein L6416_05535 [Candidatus Omnitrophica bacterium]|nr:hypothetical protein [Candidatus Omnitrophota bacterium]